MPAQNPVIVIPGITATDLHDDYPLRSEDLWTMILNKEYERVALHPDDLRYEAIEPAHVFPGRAFSIYNDLIKALRHELSPRVDRPTPVFAFPYDWRHDVRITAKRLSAFVDEVMARTELLKHYAGVRDLKVDLVGHSMGGLIICEYLSLQEARGKVGRISTIGTPFQGSVEAVVKIATGMSLLTGDEPKEREREAARLTPAVYQLFPSYRKAVVTETETEVGIFKPQNMQSSVLDSIAEFVRLYSVSTSSAERKTRAANILNKLLKGGREHRANVMRLDPSKAGVRPGSWLAVVGVGQRTRLQVTLQRLGGRNRFKVEDEDFKNYLRPTNATSRLTGDGTVPLAGAMPPPFFDERGLVCVVRGDLGFLELRDLLLVKFGGFHGLLPKVNLVQRLITKHLRPTYGGKVWGRPLPGVDEEGWAPPIRGLTPKTYF